MKSFVPHIFSAYLEGRITKDQAFAQAVFYSEADQAWLKAEIEKIEQEKTVTRQEALDESADTLDDFARAFEKHPSPKLAMLVQSAAAAYASCVVASVCPIAATMLANTAINLSKTADKLSEQIAATFDIVPDDSKNN